MVPKMPDHQGPPPLAGVTVLCSGMTDQSAKQQTQQRLASLGAVPVFKSMPNVRPDVMLATSVMAPDYQVTHFTWPPRKPSELFLP